MQTDGHDEAFCSFANAPKNESSNRCFESFVALCTQLTTCPKQTLKMRGAQTQRVMFSNRKRVNAFMLGEIVLSVSRFKV